MGKRVAFAVNGPPARWQRPGQGRNRQTGKIVRFTPTEVSAAKRTIGLAARAAWKGQPVCGPVRLSVVGVFAIPASWPPDLKAEAEAGLGTVHHIADPDLDQLVKLAQDALVGIVYVDDNQVVGYPETAKRYGPVPQTLIAIEVVDQTEAQKTPGQREMERKVAELGSDAMLARKAGWGNRSKTSRQKP